MQLRRGKTSADIDGIVSAAGAVVGKTYARSRLARVTVPAGADRAALVASLRANGAVEDANDSRMVELTTAPNDPGYSDQWDMKNTAAGLWAEGAWDIASRRGEGAIVAVLDSGIAYEDCNCPDGVFRRAPDLAGKTFVSPWDFVNDEPRANDDNGHGTLVTGVVAADTDNGYGYAGVAPRASIMPVKIINFGGQGYAADLIEGLYYAADHGARVIAMSVAFPGTGAPDANGNYCTEVVGLNAALDYANNHGSLVVASSGNSATTSDNVLCPGAYPSVLSVGATTSTATVASYSNTGSQLDVTAPGGDANGRITQETYCDRWSTLINTKMYDRFCPLAEFGTSLATPHVAGVAALLFAERPSLTPGEVSDLIRASARDAGASGWDPQSGWGLTDARAAVARLYFGAPTPTATPAPAPTATPTATPNDCNVDPDGDGMTNCYEQIRPCLNPNVADSTGDPDLDNLTSGNERLAYTDPCVRDTDGDGCGDGTELGADPRVGGGRDPRAWWDFYDVNGDRRIDSIDIALVRTRYTIDARAPELARYDRSQGPTPWAPGPPDGQIGALDVALVRASFGHVC